MRSPIHSRYFLTLLLFLCGSHASATTVRAHVSDASGAPLPDAAVALYAPTPTNFPDVANAVMDQRDKQFDPHVLVVRKNTSVRFPNKDDIRHQVYSFSPAKRFELRLYHGQLANPIVFDTAGEVALGCNIHDKMIGYIYVVDTPWFAKSDSQGSALIANVPAGTYSARLWYPGVMPTAAGLEQSVKVAASGEVTLNFQVGAPATPTATKPESELQQLFRRPSKNAP
ncbi:MAG: hypothetical protein JWM78_2557 [Verrucomicrobiaceae bacterium]|nr:hypothetical protein [Verrucomicrobiaceae bacterium]